MDIIIIIIIIIVIIISSKYLPGNIWKVWRPHTQHWRMNLRAVQLTLEQCLDPVKQGREQGNSVVDDNHRQVFLF